MGRNHEEVFSIFSIRILDPDKGDGSFENPGFLHYVIQPHQKVRNNL